MALTKVTGQVIKDTTDVTVGVLTVTNTLAVGGTVSIGGTLTYEDVTNVDAVGLITARNGIVVGSGITLSKDGDGFFTGVTTATTFSGNLSGGTVSGTTGTFSGDVDIADKIVHTGDTNTAIRFPDADTITAETGGSERLRVGAGGSVGIGTDVPDTLLHLYGSSSSQKLLTFGGGNSKRNNYIGISGADNLEIGVDENDEGSGSTFRIRIDGAEKARITSGGLLCVGHDASTGSGKIQASTGSQDGIDIFGYNSTAGNGGRLTFYRSKNATVGSNTEVADNDSLGRIDWRGYNDDGTAFNIGATIEAEVDGTIDSTTDMPSALLFKTSADGSSSPTERLRITSSGYLGIGTASVNTPLHVHNSTVNGVALFESGDAYCNIVFKDSGSTNSNKPQFGVQSDDFRFISYNGSSSTEKIRIDYEGQVIQARESIGYVYQYKRSSTQLFIIDNLSNESNTRMRIRNPNGSINYNSSSDYRLKENDVEVTDGITRLKKLRPIQFKWKTDSTTDEGFFAHEVSEACPQAVDGTKDQVATEDDVIKGEAKNIGDPIYQGIDHSKMVPLLTAALQEAVAKIEVLESKVAALESS